LLVAAFPFTFPNGDEQTTTDGIGAVILSQSDVFLIRLT
jgi:hypothetical protein